MQFYVATDDGYIPVVPGDRTAFKDAFCEVDGKMVRALDVVAPCDLPQDGLMLIMKDVLAEYQRASVWPIYNSAHEGYGVIAEEFDELERHVFTNQKRRDVDAMRAEAIQIASCAIRFVEMIDAGRARK